MRRCITWCRWHGRHWRINASAFRVRQFFERVLRGDRLNRGTEGQRVVTGSIGLDRRSRASEIVPSGGGLIAAVVSPARIGRGAVQGDGAPKTESKYDCEVSHHMSSHCITPSSLLSRFLLGHCQPGKRRWLRRVRCERKLTNQPRGAGKAQRHQQADDTRGWRSGVQRENAVTRDLNGNDRSLSFCIDPAALVHRVCQPILTGMRRSRSRNRVCPDASRQSSAIG